MRIAVVGSTGFVGSAVARAILDHGHDLVSIKAPRILIRGRTESDIYGEVAAFPEERLSPLLMQLQGVDAVVNAAGMASPGASLTDELVGANSGLPGLLVRAAMISGSQRLVHVSSAAVYGQARVLDESAIPRPASPYGYSKWWGEQVAKAIAETRSPNATELVVYRPTSVHGEGRPVTEKVRKLAGSCISSVAAPGDAPTPQVMVESVASLAVHLLEQSNPPSTPVLHPWEGWTTASFLEYMGDGREPVQLPVQLVNSILALAYLIGRLHPRLNANARRLDMLWRGQATITHDVAHPEDVL